MGVYNARKCNKLTVLFEKYGVFVTLFELEVRIKLTTGILM